MSEITREEDPEAQTHPGRDSMSRRRFMVATGGAGALSVLLVACGDDDDEQPATTEQKARDEGALSQFGEGDLGILNYALTLEYIESAFYADVVKSGLFKGDDLALIRSFGADEQAHVGALTATVRKLGGKPAARPKTEFPLDSAKSVLDLAATVENLGAAAYLGQAASIESDEVLAAALSIHSVEARHASALGTLTDKSFVPDGPFAKPADAGTVLAQVKPFIVG